MCVCVCVCFSFEVICYIVFYLILTISSSFDTIAAWVRDSTMWSDSLCVVVSLSADLRLCADVELQVFVLRIVVSNYALYVFSLCSLRLFFVC